MSVQHSPKDEATMLTSEMDEVTRRWRAREEDRVRAAAERSRQVQDQSDPRESVDTFAPAFREELREVRGRLGGGAQVESTADAKAALQTLQQRLAAAAYWLPQYELRQLQAELAEAQAEAAKVTGPRKRFAFSSRRAVAAEAPPGAPEVVPSSQGAERQSTPSPPPHPAASSQTYSNALSVSQAPAGTAVCIDASGRDVTMNGLQSMRINLTGCPTAVYVTDATDCHIRAGPVAGACLIQGAAQCTFELAAHQIRIHRSQGCSFSLRVASNPIIEHSRDLEFGPLATTDEEAQVLAQQGLLDTDSWSRVQDFGWLKAGPSPNWRARQPGS